MSSGDQLHLPKIDFSKLSLSSTGTEEWAETRALVMSAIKIYGCFEAVYDKVTPELQDALFGQDMKDLFSLPLETKVKNTSALPYYGYIGNIPGKKYESLNIDNATQQRGVDEFSTLMWGDEGNPKFCDKVLEFSRHVSELEQMVRKMLLESLAVEKYFDRQTQSVAYSLRLSEYGVPPGVQQVDHPRPSVAMQSHKDSTILSIVCQHGVEGLEILTKHEKWLAPSPNSLTVLIGEAIWAWSNGRIEPTWHRVMMTGDETRYSAIFSARPRAGCMVEAPEELIDDDHPLLFRPYEYGDYIGFAYSEAGFKSKCALTSYCGIIRGDGDE